MITQYEFNTAFNEILKGSIKRLYWEGNKTRFEINTTTRFEISQKKRKWLIEYDNNPENPHFWYNYERIYVILQNKFSLDHTIFQEFMIHIMHTQFNIDNAIPSCRHLYYGKRAEHKFKMKNS